MTLQVVCSSLNQQAAGSMLRSSSEYETTGTDHRDAAASTAPVALKVEELVIKMSTGYRQCMYLPHPV